MYRGNRIAGLHEHFTRGGWRGKADTRGHYHQRGFTRGLTGEGITLGGYTIRYGPEAGPENVAGINLRQLLDVTANIPVPQLLLYPSLSPMMDLTMIIMKVWMWTWRILLQYLTL